MKYGSVCSGIEAATVAWHPLGWEPAFFSEIERFPRAVLAHRYPEVPLHGDFTTIGADDFGAIDLLVGGTPCQDFSVAGLRAGLAGDRGALTIEFVRLAGRLRPKWLVWENVPGVLSADGGRAFGTFIGLLGQLGYGFAYRVLNAQFFGVPQRRRRVFVVGCLGDWRSAAAVLFERASLSGHPTPRREAGEDIALCVTARFGSGRCDPTAETYIAQTLAANSGRNHIEQTCVAHTLKADGFDASEDGTGRGVPLVVAFGAQVESPFLEECALPVTARNGDAGMVAFSFQDHGADAGNVAPTLRAGGNATGGDRPPGTDVDTVESLQVSGGAVRRITPVECERLQGFPPGWTAVPYRGKPAADGPRYRALGNSMAVPCMAWIGRRIAMVESRLAEAAA